MEPSVDFEEHFVEMPSVARSRRLVTQSVGVSLAELKAPFSDCLIAESHTADR
jgi:hypothetical protein